MIDLEPEVVAGLPVDKLGLLLLADMAETKEWNEYNYLLSAKNAYRDSKDALEAIAEAVAWLKARALIAKDPQQSSDNSIFVTRTGRRALEHGEVAFRATERLQIGLHAKIESRARPQFLIGEYELGVFSSMKEVEIRVRALGGFGSEIFGDDLMNKAFGSTGPLTDPGMMKGEQEGIRMLFVGTYRVFRNPAGHRAVAFDDVTEAAEMVQTASLLMRILDRVEARLQGG